MIFRTTPFEHQLKSFELAKDKEYWGHFHEMGAGKTKIAIDTANHLFCEKKIGGVLVIAPNGVHSNWANQEIYKHSYYRNPVYHWIGKPTSQKRKKMLNGFLELSKNPMYLGWLCINIEAIRTPAGYRLCELFLKQQPCMIVVDESTIIKTPKAKQTKAALYLATLAPYRRILTGTPITQGPLDFYSQCKFLAKHSIPFSSYTAFKNTFAHEQTIVLNSGKRFNTVVGYKSLGLLKELIEPFSDRILKKDCLDLPEKLYEEISVEMTTKQRQVYDNMRDLYITQLEDQEQTTGMVTAQNALTLLMKLQQIATGFVIDDEDNIHEIPNNRIEKLGEIISGFSGKAIIWCAFRKNIESVYERLRDAYGPRSVVHYYGETSREGRKEAIDRFQNDPECRFFVSNKTGSEGITLTAAEYAIYYSNTYSLHSRMQSEDRCHRIGQSKNVLYIDLYCDGTVDKKILQALKTKKDLADTVLTNWRDLF